MNFILKKKSLILKFICWKKKLQKKKPRNCNSSWFLRLFHLRFLIWNILYLCMSPPSWRRYSWGHLGRWHGLGDRRLQRGRGRERQRLRRPFGIHLSRSWWSENWWIFFSESIQRLTDCQPSLVESWLIFREKSQPMKIECIFVEAAGEKKWEKWFHGSTSKN